MMSKRYCITCKHRRRYSYQQPCKFCIEEGYGANPMYKPMWEVDEKE